MSPHEGMVQACTSQVTALRSFTPRALKESTRNVVHDVRFACCSVSNARMAEQIDSLVDIISNR